MLRLRPVLMQWRGRCGGATRKRMHRWCCTCRKWWRSRLRRCPGGQVWVVWGQDGRAVVTQQACLPAVEAAPKPLTPVACPPAQSAAHRLPGEPGPAHPSEERFLAFGRVFSGAIRQGQTVQVGAASVECRRRLHFKHGVVPLLALLALPSSGTACLESHPLLPALRRSQSAGAAGHLQPR